MSLHDDLPDLEVRIDVVTNELAAHIIAGRHEDGWRLLAELRELAWRRRALLARCRQGRRGRRGS